MDPITMMAIGQGLAGLGQTIGGAIQRRKAEKAAEAQIGKLGPDQGILSYYNQALQRYGVSPAQTALYKRQMANIQRAAATGLAGAGGARGRMGAASSIARSMSDAALNAETAAEQQQNLRFGQLGTAAQLAAAEKRRPEEIRLQMQLQKAAGGSQIANAGLSNIFSALQSGAMASMYGGGGSGSTGRIGGRGRVTAAELGSMGRTPVGISASQIAGPRISATPSRTRGISMMPPVPSSPLLPRYLQQQPPYFY